MCILVSFQVMLEDECVRVWCERLGEGLRPLRTFKRFYNEVLTKDEVFAKLSPSALVEWQQKAKGRDAYRIKDLAQSWINSQPLRFKSKHTMLSHISSFFLHNHAPLPPDLGFHFTSDVPPVEGNLTVEDLKRILHNCNKMYRAVFLMMAQGLMGEAEVVYVSNNLWRKVLTHLTKNIGVFKLTLPGRKRNRNVTSFFTMLSTQGDWAHAMRAYVKSCPGSFLGALFRNERGKPLNAQNIRHYFHWRAVDAGIIEQFTPECDKCQSETVRVRKLYPPNQTTKKKRVRKVAYVCRNCGNVDWACGVDENFASVRYGVNPHEIRDLMRSRWRASGAKIVVAEFMMEHGEQVDPNEYDKMKYTPGYAETEYRKALPWLNILSEDPETVDRTTVEAELDGYRTQNEILSREVARLRHHVSELQKSIMSGEERKSIRELLELMRKKKVKVSL